MSSKTFCDPNDFDIFRSSTNGGANGSNDSVSDDTDDVIAQNLTYIIQETRLWLSVYYLLFIIYCLSFILSSSVFFEGILTQTRTYVILLSISDYFIVPN